MSITVINLTQHQLTNDQVAAATWIPDYPEQVAEVRNLLTFADIPSANEMRRRASELVKIANASGATYAMIGGAPFFMSTLEGALKEAGIQPVYAFSERVVVEETTADGETVKKTVFRHGGWVYA